LALNPLLLFGRIPIARFTPDSPPRRNPREKIVPKKTATLGAAVFADPPHYHHPPREQKVGGGIGRCPATNIPTNAPPKAHPNTIPTMTNSLIFLSPQDLAEGGGHLNGRVTRLKKLARSSGFSGCRHMTRPKRRLPAPLRARTKPTRATTAPATAYTFGGFINQSAMESISSHGAVFKSTPGLVNIRRGHVALIEGVGVSDQVADWNVVTPSARL
jgi:hypothetical protein